MFGFLYSLFFGACLPMNQLNKTPNIAELGVFVQLWRLRIMLIRHHSKRSLFIAKLALPEATVTAKKGCASCAEPPCIIVTHIITHTGDIDPLEQSLGI